MLNSDWLIHSSCRIIGYITFFPEIMVKSHEIKFYFIYKSNYDVTNLWLECGSGFFAMFFSLSLSLFQLI